MRVGISFNPRHKVAHEVAARLEKILDGGGHVLVKEENGRIPSTGLDLLVCIGGDGTILRALQSCDAPILGINTSVVGFLSEVGPDAAEKALGRTLSGDYTLEERMRISTSVGGRKVADATNEILIHASEVGHLRHFHLWVNDEMAVDLNADGLLVSTPTGSTAYNLSAGGPLVDPRVEAIVITAIAPFKLSHRPLVAPAQARLRIALAVASPCTIVVDGQGGLPIEGNEDITMVRAKGPARFVRFSNDFYSRVNERLALKQGQKYHTSP